MEYREPRFSWNNWERIAGFWAVVTIMIIVIIIIIIITLRMVVVYHKQFSELLAQQL